MERRPEFSRTLQKHCSMFGSVRVNNICWVWDYVSNCPVREEEMPDGSERWDKSERARWAHLEIPEGDADGTSANNGPTATSQGRTPLRKLKTIASVDRRLAPRAGKGSHRLNRGLATWKAGTSAGLSKLRPARGRRLRVRPSDQRPSLRTAVGGNSGRAR
jgi:hypothetical protein